MTNFPHQWGRGQPIRFPANARIGIWGQSNALGRANRSDISASPLSNDPGLATYDAGTFARVRIWDGTTYSLLQPSVNNLCAAGQFGPEFGLAVRWMRETTSGTLFIDKWSSSGLSITDNYFTHGQYPYTQAQTYRTQSNAWFAANGITAWQEAWIWVQGETDYLQTESWYQGNLETLMGYQISDGFHAASDRCVLVQMAVGSAQYGSGVAAAKTVVAAEPSKGVSTALATDLYMNGDNLHFNGRGQVQLAYNCFEYIFTAPHIAT